jgi:hypothetical protein
MTESHKRTKLPLRFFLLTATLNERLNCLGYHIGELLMYRELAERQR